MTTFDWKDEDLKEDFEDAVEKSEKYDYNSEVLRDLAKSFIETGQNVDALESRLNQLQRDREKIQTEINNLSDREDEINKKIQEIKERINEIENQDPEDEEPETLGKFYEVFKKQYNRDSWTESSDVESYWMAETGLTQKELWDRGLDYIGKN